MHVNQPFNHEQQAAAALPYLFYIIVCVFV
jgi:hypothetical protein